MIYFVIFTWLVAWWSDSPSLSLWYTQCPPQSAAGQSVSSSPSYLVLHSPLVFPLWWHGRDWQSCLALSLQPGVTLVRVLGGALGLQHLPAVLLSPGAAVLPLLQHTLPLSERGALLPPLIQPAGGDVLYVTLFLTFRLSNTVMGQLLRGFLDLAVTVVGGETESWYQVKQQQPVHYCNQAERETPTGLGYWTVPALYNNH